MVDDRKYSRRKIDEIFYFLQLTNHETKDLKNFDFLSLQKYCVQFGLYSYILSKRLRLIPNMIQLSLACLIPKMYFEGEMKE